MSSWPLCGHPSEGVAAYAHRAVRPEHIAAQGETSPHQHIKKTSTRDSLNENIPIEVEIYRRGIDILRPLSIIHYLSVIIV